MTRTQRIFVGFLALAFLLAAGVYWFLGNYIDPVGTVLLIFAGLSIAFGFAVMLRATAIDR